MNARVLVTGMGGELGTRVAQLIEARDWAGDVVGVDFVPPFDFVPLFDFVPPLGFPPAGTVCVPVNVGRVVPLLPPVCVPAGVAPLATGVVPALPARFGVICAVAPAPVQVMFIAAASVPSSAFLASASAFSTSLRSCPEILSPCSRSIFSTL